MCGIWAIIKKNPDLKYYINSINNIKNRGPESSNIYNNNNMIIAFHRLAINDLSIMGIQPFYYSYNDYNYLLVANGEIYNHKFLEDKYNIDLYSNSDCEFLLKLFILFNEDFLKFNNIIRGEYAILIIKEHKINKTINYWFSVDPLSVRPLFYDIKDDSIYISSLLSGISEHSNNIKRLDQGTYIEGFTDMENFNYNKKINYYYRPLPIYNLESDILYKSIINTLEDCVKIRLVSDKPIGCLLSGGLDSSLIAALASKELKKNGKKLRTFSIGMENGTDLIYAKKVAEHIDSDHTEFIFTPEEGLSVIDEVIKCTETYDITTIRASVGQYLLAKKILENTDIKVLLNGDGADECQMGYIYFYLHPNINEAYLERNKLLEQIHYFDGLRVDRNISYHGLEARVPYLDREFVDLYYKIYPELLIPTKDRIEKHLIRKAFFDFLPDLLPNEILWRKKEAFSDGISSKEKSWFNILLEYYNKNVIEENLEITKETYYYKNKFKELFGDNEQILPRYWLPNWTNTKDPSARTLEIYK